MKTTDYIRMTLEMSAGEALALIEEMRDAPLTFPTSNGGNHPLWVLGHHTVAEAKIVQEIMLGRPNPLAHWLGMFGPGTKAVADATRYPPLDEVMARFREVRANTLQALASLNDADLDQPSKNCPPEYQPFVGTVGQCFRQVGAHLTYHAGQVADAHRMAGR